MGHIKEWKVNESRFIYLESVKYHSAFSNPISISQICFSICVSLHSFFFFAFQFGYRIVVVDA